MARKRIGVVLFQLGGPDGPDSVEPYLYNLFSDPDIMDIPLGGLLRRPMARWIARRRAAHVREAYAEIGDGSPIRLLTHRQARALEDALRPRLEVTVVVAMRYWHPFTSEAVAQLTGAAPDEIVLLPLYPQYCHATTGSALNEWRRCFRNEHVTVRIVEKFYDHPGYINALVEKIRVSLSHFTRPAPESSADAGPVSLIFSAHGVPMRLIERGDPYQKQIEETVRLVVERGRELAARGGLVDSWPASHSLCYQSKVGRREWLAPSLEAEISRLAGSGVRRMLVVPVSFVSEHVESLHEINLEARRQARSLGVAQFEMMPALGDSPTFIAALADLVLHATQPASDL